MSESRPRAATASFAIRETIAYICAVVFPLAAVWMTAHSPALHGVPFALIACVIAGLGALAGPGPAIVSILVCVFALALPISPLYREDTLTLAQFERGIVLFAACFFLVALSWKQRSGERRLRAALASLQERTDALTQAQQASELAAWVLDADTRETSWDEGSTQVFGFPFINLRGRPIPMENVVPEDRVRVRETLDASIGTDKFLHLEFRVRWTNGELHWLEMRGVQVSRLPNLWRGCTFDVTRRKAIEGALIHSEKLAAVGRLASTVAHEVNNPLEAVTNLLYLISNDPNLNEDSRSYLSLAEEELARLANITRLTLTFARSASTRTRVLASDILDAVLVLFQRRAEHLSVSIERSYAPDLAIEIPPHELRQILINLVANAIDALSAENQSGLRLLRLRTQAEDNRAILFVEDNGVGIHAADQSRIFDPFFTTKSDVGTGIGLWVTRELVEKNSGAISVESDPLAGNIRTSFRIAFPAAEPVPEQTIPAPQETASRE